MSSAARNCSLSSWAGRRVLAAALLASGASFTVWSAVTVALPSIQDHFGTNITGIQWVVNSHRLTLASLLLIGGSLGDHFGRKKVFVTGMLVFAAGAVLSGFAWSVPVLIGFQAFQEIGSALMVPQSLAIINACFAEDERGRAIGVWAGVSGGIAALGPWLGGWLVETVGWSAVFWMTVPVVATALAITLLFIPESRDKGAGRLDWPGTVFVLLGLLSVVNGLISGPVKGWDTPIVWGGLIGGAACIAIFVWVETKMPGPLIPLGIFRNPLVSGANAVTLLLYFAFNGVVVFSVLNLEQIQGYSPAEAGLGLLPPIIIITLLAAPAGTLADRLGPRIQMIAGPLVVAAGVALLIVGGTDASYFRHFLPGLMVVGAGMAFVIAPLTKSALSVDQRLSGAASGISNAVARTAGLLAVAVLGAVMVAVFLPNLREMLASSGLTPEQQDAVLGQYDKLGGIVVPESFDGAARAIARSAVRESFIASYRSAMGVCAGLAALGAVISFFTIHRRRWEHEDRKRAACIGQCPIP